MVGVTGLVGISLDPHGRGLIAGVALIIGLAGDAMAAHFHINRRPK